MFGRIRVTLGAAMAVGALLALGASAAHANVLSLLPGTCGAQPESQPFGFDGERHWSVAPRHIQPDRSSGRWHTARPE